MQDQGTEAGKGPDRRGHLFGMPVGEFVFNLLDPQFRQGHLDSILEQIKGDKGLPTFVIYAGPAPRSAEDPPKMDSNIEELLREAADRFFPDDTAKNQSTSNLASCQMCDSIAHFGMFLGVYERFLALNNPKASSKTNSQETDDVPMAGI